MERTIFTSKDIMNIMENVFKENTETISIESFGETKEVDICSYLDVDFYTYKKDTTVGNTHSKNFALVEALEEEATISPDIDFVEKTGKITFLMQESKAGVLEYYLQKIRNKYIGVPEKIMNNYGETLNAYLLFGIMQYEEAPETVSSGRSIICSIGFKITYLTNALTYSDYDISLSFDNEKYYQIPINEISMQIIFANDQLAKYSRNDLAGIRNKTCSFVISMSFYDFIRPLTELINEKFMIFTATKKNGQDIGIQNINETIYLKIKINNENEYLILCTYDNIQKRMENASYSSTSLTLKGSATNVI